MQPFQMPMPWAVRLRALYALRDDDGASRLIYDLERAAIVEVPEELQEYIERALDCGDLDEALLGWLQTEDLLTAEAREGWQAAGLAGWSARSELGLYSLLEDQLEAQIDATSEASAEVGLDRALRQAAGAARVTLRLRWSGAVLARKVLEQVVVLGRRHLRVVAAEVDQRRPAGEEGGADKTEPEDQLPLQALVVGQQREAAVGERSPALVDESRPGPQGTDLGMRLQESDLPFQPGRLRDVVLILARHVPATRRLKGPVLGSGKTRIGRVAQEAHAPIPTGQLRQNVPGAIR